MTNLTQKMLEEIIKMGRNTLVDVTCSYEEQIIEVHTVGQMIELCLEDAEALAHKLLAITQDWREAQQGVVHPECS